MREQIELIDLTAYSQPPWNHARSVANALEAVLDARDNASSLHAYHGLLYAVGNDHSGTYYSIALGVQPSLTRILSEGGPWSQHAVLEALIDLYGLFEPEPGQELYRGQSLARLVRDVIADLEPIVASLEKTSDITRTNARELLDLLHE